MKILRERVFKSAAVNTENHQQGKGIWSKEINWERERTWKTKSSQFFYFLFFDFKKLDFS
jgi:hypothetical protein